MKRVIGLILLLAVIFAVPPLRQRLGELLQPVAERLGPVGDFFANPVLRYSARNKAKHVLNVIDLDAEQGKKGPMDPETFLDWMKDRIPEETGLDPWGNEYWMQLSERTRTIGSSGPDGERGTDDDVTETEPL